MVLSYKRSLLPNYLKWWGRVDDLFIFRLFKSIFVLLIEFHYTLSLIKYWQIIIIYHDFLPPPWRVSHVKSDNTHNHQHTRLSPLLLLLLKKVGSARLRDSDIHPISPKTPAPQYQPIDRKKRKGKRVEDYSKDRAA